MSVSFVRHRGASSTTPARPTDPPDWVPELWFRILGPVSVVRGGQPLDLGPRQQRALLAALLAHCGEAVSLHQLVDLLWPDDPPPSAVNAVHRYVGTLRRIFEPDLPARTTGRWLLREADSYRMAVDADTCDLARFRALVRGARDQPEPGARSGALLAALLLWRGPAGAGLELVQGAAIDLDAVTRERSVAATEAADAALAAEVTLEQVEAIRDAASADPLNEALQARLVRVLKAAGLQAEAIEVYHGIREQLSTMLDLRPGPLLAQAYLEALEDDQDGDRPAARPARPGGSGLETGHPVPAQLPPDLLGFTGRQAELADLREHLDAAGNSDGLAVQVLHGLGGVGKTALAVHWAHTIADRFPDGQLYVNLGGFGPEGSDVPVGEVLHGFLTALGVPAGGVPDRDTERAALYRSLAAKHRLLVLLDNARDVDQVRPLLPGTSAGLVVATSRNRLTGVTATQAAHALEVRPLSGPEALESLTGRLGAGRVAGEPAAARRLSRSTGGLPIAVAVIAGRLNSHPEWTLSMIADELRDAARRMSALSADDPLSDVRAVFTWSYRLLSPDAARMFRLGTVHRGPDIPLLNAASVSGLPIAQAAACLAELSDVRLLEEPRPSRYTVHDLVAAFADTLSAEIDGGMDRRSALARQLDHYLLSAQRAAYALGLPLVASETRQSEFGAQVQKFRDRAEARAWVTSERELLIAAVRNAGVHGFGWHEHQLADYVRRFA